MFFFFPLVGLGLSLLNFCLTGAAGEAQAQVQSQDRTQLPSSFEGWTQFQWSASQDRLLLNISPEGAQKGIVLASPSRENPNYYYHWTRDAALTMKTLFHLYQLNPSRLSGQLTQNLLMTHLHDFVALTLRQGEEQSVGGLGEPKYNVDGHPFTGPWGRPQNDGPAIRALALMELAQYLLDQGGAKDETFVRQYLYDSKLPSRSAIKRDLEYVSHHWQETDYDLWEEIKGHHFFTRMLQRKALLTGAQLAQRLGDPGAAQWYQMQVGLLEKELDRHWSLKDGIIVSTLDRSEGIDYKSGLDASIILAVIHAHPNKGPQLDDDSFFGLNDERVMATAAKLARVFSSIYSVNFGGPKKAPAIGRYPEDHYDGYTTSSLGNPWFLSTLMMSEYLYRLAQKFQERGRIEVTLANAPFFSFFLPEVGGNQLPTVILKDNPLFSQIITGLENDGDQFLERVRLHLGSDGNITEQLNRSTGFMQGAPDLTWAHASFIEALLARKVR